MKNKIKRKLKNKISREKLKRMLNDETELDNMKKIIESELSESDVELIMDITRESRLDGLFDNFNIDKDKLAKAKKKIIKLHPKSTEWPLLSTLYRNHKGKYKAETLFNEYHDSTLSEGMIFGITYGKKFLVEDIQNNRFSKEDIINMSKDEIFSYCDEDWQRI